jgi:cytidylate kinase
VLTDTRVKAALEAEVEARAKRAKSNMLFRNIQEKSQKPKQLEKECLKS